LKCSAVTRERSVDELRDEPRAEIIAGPCIDRRPLPREFYNRPAVEVARDLLGKVLTHHSEGARTAGRIVETEAYLGTGDLAAHSARGVTPRTRVIFGAPGHAYVYLIYGMYECLNMVTDAEGVAGCVLIRALEPLAGLDVMRGRRPPARRIEDLANGPGKLTLAMGITRHHNGSDLTHGSLTVHAPAERHGAHLQIGVSPRIGIAQSRELPLRFFIRGNGYVSK
jgi:DNA-3-methyladenine glycosylase